MIPLKIWSTKKHPYIHCFIINLHVCDNPTAYVIDQFKNLENYKQTLTEVYEELGRMIEKFCSENDPAWQFLIFERDQILEIIKKLNSPSSNQSSNSGMSNKRAQ